jgi:CheY-like chemotaxis protein
MEHRQSFEFFADRGRGGAAPVVLRFRSETVMKNILVVDDDAGVRGLLRRVIGDMGYRVTEAEDAMSALEVLEEKNVSLALVDVRMPGRDGVWLVDQIVTRFPGTPVALATGLTEMDPNVTLRAGVVGYVVKPFKRDALADVIRAALVAAPPEPAKDFDLTAFDLM